MSSHHYAVEIDSTSDSVASSPRSDYVAGDGVPPLVRFMCSFGGKILPRPHDNQLRYVGGDTRIIAVHRHATTFSSLLAKLGKLAGAADFTVKYQLPNEDLDALITIASDEDLENMMDEYDRFFAQNSKASRLRLFLFCNESVSRTSSISSLLGGSAKREHWFLDALNGGAGPGLERGRSEVSSIMSEVPDYLFGLENSDDPPREAKQKSRLNLAETVSNSDPGSPAPVVSSPFCSTSSSLAQPVLEPPPLKTAPDHTIPELRPVKTKPDNLPFTVADAKVTHVENYGDATDPPAAIHTGFPGNPSPWQYIHNSHYQGPTAQQVPGTVQQVPVYYVPSTVQGGNIPVQSVPIRAQYVQPFTGQPGQIPVGFRQPVQGITQVYGGGVRPAAAVDAYEMSTRAIPDGVNQPVYYAVRNGRAGMGVLGGEEVRVNGSM